MHAHARPCTHAHRAWEIRTRMHSNTHTHTHAHTHIHTHIHIHAEAHAHAQTKQAHSNTYNTYQGCLRVAWAAHQLVCLWQRKRCSTLRKKKKTTNPSGPFKRTIKKHIHIQNACIRGHMHMCEVCVSVCVYACGGVYMHDVCAARSCAYLHGTNSHNRVCLKVKYLPCLRSYDWGKHFPMRNSVRRRSCQASSAFRK